MVRRDVLAKQKSPAGGGTALSKTLVATSTYLAAGIGAIALLDTNLLGDEFGGFVYVLVSPFVSPSRA